MLAKVRTPTRAPAKGLIQLEATFIHIRCLIYTARKVAFKFLASSAVLLWA